MQNVHGKEIDLLRTTVKIPGKRPPRAVATVAPTASPKTNGLTKDRSTLQLGIGNTGTISCPYYKAKGQRRTSYVRSLQFRYLRYKLMYNLLSPDKKMSLSVS